MDALTPKTEIVVPPVAQPAAINPLTLRLLQAPIVPLILKLVLAEHDDHAGAGGRSVGRHLVAGEARQRRACRHGAGVSVRAAGRHRVRRIDRRRHFRRRGARTRRAAAGAGRRRLDAWADHQCGDRRLVCRRDADLRPLDLSGDRRPRWRTGSGADLFERAVRRQHAVLDHERADERDPRHRQHVRACARLLRRRGADAAAVALPDLRPWAVSGARHRRQRDLAARHLCRRDDRSRLVHSLRPLRRQVQAHDAALADIRRHPEHRRRGHDRLAADQPDGVGEQRAGVARSAAPAQSPATAPPRGSNS